MTVPEGSSGFMGCWLDFRLLPPRPSMILDGTSKTPLTSREGRLCAGGTGDVGLLARPALPKYSKAVLVLKAEGGSVVVSVGAGTSSVVLTLFLDFKGPTRRSLFLGRSIGWQLASCLFRACWDGKGGYWHPGCGHGS